MERKLVTRAGELNRLAERPMLRAKDGNANREGQLRS